MLMATAAAWAQYAVVDGVRYELSSDKAYVVAPESGIYTGAIAIPATISYGGNDYAVTDIKSGAFENSTITSLSLPVGLRYIFSSFAGTSLTSLTIPGTVMYLTAMGSCTSLTSITFAYDGIDEITDEYYWPSGYPKGIELLWDCFTGCTNLTEINVDRPLYNRGANYTALFGKATKATFGPHATNIPMACFYGVTTLQQLTIGANVTEIETNAFKQGALPSGSAFPFSQMKKIETEAFYECKNLPAAIDLSSTEEIGNQAFYMCLDIQSATLGSCEHAGAFWGCTNLTSLTLLDGITEISNSAFYNMTNLTNIKLPSTLKKIGNQAFYGCENLNFSDGLPEGLEEIGDYAFDHCSKLNVTLPSTLKTIGTGAFSYCESLTEAKIPAGVTYLNPYIFYFCSGLKSVTIPGTVTGMVQTIYYCDNLEEITFEEGSETITLRQPLGEFSEKLKKVYIDRNFEWMSVPSGGGQFGRLPEVIEFGPHVTSIPASALNQQDVKKVILGSNVKSIGANAFYYCRQLEEITIPGSVETIGDECWRDCSNITKVTFENGPKTLTLGNDVFKDCPFTDLVLDHNYTYATDAPLSSQLKRVTIGAHVTTIPRYAFKDCTLENSITMPSSLKEIMYNAFNNCTVPAITLNEGLETIGQSAFQKCTATFNGVPSTVKSIDQSAFSGCTGLTGALVLPAGLTMGLYAFDSCTGLTSLTVPGTVTSLSRSFEDCTNITEVRIEYGKEPISIHKACFSNDPCTNVYIDRAFSWDEAGGSSFYGFKKTENIEFGSHVTAIPNKALYWSNSLTNVTMTDNVRSIGDKAFYSANLTGLKLSKNIETIGEEAFQNAIFNNSFTFPITVKTIGDVSFHSTSLKDVYVPWLTPLALEDDSKSWTIGRFSYATDQTLWVPGGTMAAYKDATVWKNFQKFDYWSFVVSATVAGKGTLKLANGEAVTDNGTNTEKTVKGEKLVTEGAGEAVSGLFVREKDLTLTPTPARGYEVAIKANGADVAAVEGAYKIASLTANQTIAATFTPIKYTLTYDLAGGTLAEGQENPATYTVESDAITLKNPTRKGYTFEGWTGTELEKATVEVTIAKNSIGNRSYKATWKPIVYTISYDAAGGTLAEGNPATYTIETADISLKAPTRRGYTFEGWTGTGLTEATKTVTIAKGSTENREYKATWKVITYTIDYDLAGGALPTGMSNPATYTVENDVITLKNPTRANYEFAGWTGTGLTAATMEVTIAKGSIDNRKYTATWKPVSYKLNYDLAEGSLPAGKANPATYNIETADFTLVNPVRAHYDFAGWTGTGLSAATMTVTVTKGSSGERSYTATWTPCIYNVAISKTGEGTVEATKLKPQYTDDVMLTITPAQNYELAKLTVDGTDVTADVKDGKYTISNVSADVTVVADFKLTVIPGDVNASGKVDIVDVTTTIDYILGKNPKGFIKAAADINNDGDVNIVDVTSIIDIILGKK